MAPNETQIEHIQTSNVVSDAFTSLLRSPGILRQVCGVVLAVCPQHQAFLHALFLSQLPPDSVISLDGFITCSIQRGVEALQRHR